MSKLDDLVLRKAAAAKDRGLTEDEGFIVEAAEQLGFAPAGDDDGNVYICNTADILLLAGAIAAASFEQAKA